MCKKWRTTGLNKQRLAVHALSFHLDSFLCLSSELFRGLNVKQCIKFLHFPQAKKEWLWSNAWVHRSIFTGINVGNNKR